MQEKQTLEPRRGSKNRPKIKNEYPADTPKAEAKPPGKPRIGIYRQRGGQPGNQNAAKRGWYTKEAREARARIKDVLKKAYAAIAWAEEKHGLRRKRGRPRKQT